MRAMSKCLILEDAGRSESVEDDAITPFSPQSVVDNSSGLPQPIDNQTSISALAKVNRADILSASSFIARTLLSNLYLKEILKTALLSNRQHEKAGRLMRAIKQFSAQLQTLAQSQSKKSTADFISKHYRRVTFATLEQLASEKMVHADKMELLRQESSNDSGRFPNILALATQFKSMNNGHAPELMPSHPLSYEEPRQTANETEISFITGYSPYFNLLDSIFKDIAMFPEPNEIVKFVTNFLDNTAKLPMVAQQALFYVEWEMPIFMQEFNKTPSLGQILVFSGTLINAQASTVKEYISLNWPIGGIPVLRALEDVQWRIEGNGVDVNMMFPNAKDYQTLVTVKSVRTSVGEQPNYQTQICVEGTPSVQAEAAATISWLAAAIRHSDNMELSGSQSSLTDIFFGSRPDFQGAKP